MLPALSSTQLRKIDQDAVAILGIPSLILMENAARGVCDVVNHRRPWRSITILAGPGNNGGDGLAVARLLAATGVQATVFLIRGDKKLSTDAAQNLLFLQNSGLIVTEPTLSDIEMHLGALSADDLLIDAILGTGIRGKVMSPFSDLIRMINSANAEVLSVDVPSGLDCDSGTPAGTCVQADSTVTLVAMKQGFLNESSREFTGEVEVCQIGIPHQWLQQWLEQ